MKSLARDSTPPVCRKSAVMDGCGAYALTLRDGEGRWWLGYLGMHVDDSGLVKDVSRNFKQGPSM